MSLGSTSTGAVLVILVAGLVAFAPQTAFAQSTTMVLEGTVTDAETGEPLGAYVRVASWSGERGDRRHYDETKTDEKGRFRIEVPGDRGHVEIVAADQAHHRYDFSFTANDTKPFAIALKPFPPKDAVVTGVVIDAATGKPVAGAQVSVSPDWSHRAEPATPPQETLVDPAAGSEKPASDAPVRCCYDRPSDHASMVTGEDGRYRFALYAGAHQISVSARDFAYTYERFTVAEGDEKTLDVELERVPAESVVLRGVVRDAQTNLPIQNAHVSVQNLEWSRWNGTQTDRLGRFEIRTLPGFTQISVHSWGVGIMTVEARDEAATTSTEAASGEGATTLIAAPDIAPAPSGGPAYYTWILSLDLEAGEREISIDLKPKPRPSIPLVGYIVDGATKKAIPGAWINVQNEDTGEWGHAQADKDGSYRILVRPGYHVIHAHADGYFQKGVIREIEKGDGAVRFDIVLEPGTPKYAPYPHYAIAEADASGAPSDKRLAGGLETPSAPSSNDGLARAAGDGSTRQGAASYQGGAGNLGPYDPDAAPGKLPGKPLPTPGLAGVAAVAVLGLAALALHRKHR